MMIDYIMRLDALIDVCIGCNEEFPNEPCEPNDCKIKMALSGIPTADVRENVQLDVCPLYGGVCGYPSGECYDCPRHGNFRENVRGEWIFPYGNKKYKRCSVCGKTFYSIPATSNYCPNCGAEMRKGGAE